MYFLTQPFQTCQPPTAIRLRQGFGRLRQSFSVGARTKTATAKASADKDRQPSTVNQKKASRLKDA